MTRLLDTVTQERRADRKLERAVDMFHEHQSLIDDEDRITTKMLIESAEEMKFGLRSKQGIQKLTQARAYRKAVGAAYKFIKRASNKGRDTALSSN